VLALSRQNTTVFNKEDTSWKTTIRKGAYIAQKAKGKPEAVIIATGSEVNMAMEAASISGKDVQVVSMISRELFEKQSEAVKNEVIPQGTRCLVCEAGVRQGWEGWAKAKDILSIDRFGESGPGDKVAEHLGFTAASLAKMI